MQFDGYFLRHFVLFTFLQGLCLGEHESYKSHSVIEKTVDLVGHRRN
jgi:hypothetical protein